MSDAYTELPEPDSPDAVASWIEARSRSLDRFGDVFQTSLQHRADHDCDTYPSRESSLLGVLVASFGAKRILEVGCGLGYSALWLAFGSSPDGRVDTVERDPGHATAARENFERYGYADRISILEGEDLPTLRRLAGPYDFAFYDADVPQLEHLECFERLTRTGAVLASANLFLGQYVPDLVGLDASYREALLTDGRWSSAFAGHLLLSVRL